ncbi:uncharacterized protein LOC102801447 [Saccoglossus kowalevskii]
MEVTFLFHALLIVLQISAGEVTFFNAKAVVRQSGDYFIGGYSSGESAEELRSSFKYGRVIDIGTGGELPDGFRIRDRYDFAKRLYLPEGAGRPGVYYCDVMDVRFQTVVLSLDASILPESHTKTVSWGENMSLGMVIKSTTISATQLKWKHNGVDIEAWNGQSSITITSAKPSDAGIYECYSSEEQRRNGLHGFMRLIVRGCPNGKYGVPNCLNNCPSCYNGGICNAETGECVCPPGFKGNLCKEGCGNNYWGHNCDRQCSSHKSDVCRSRLLCLQDPYGCSCQASYTGLDCFEDCPQGKYGSGCTQTCHCTTGCNKETGACNNGGSCITGFSGHNCQVSSSCSTGFYGELCNYNCHCKNNAACDKNTGVCPNGDCAPGWINLDTIDSDCQQDGSVKFGDHYTKKVNPGEETYFICEVISNPVIQQTHMMLVNEDTAEYVTISDYYTRDTYIAVGNYSGVVVNSTRDFVCHVPHEMISVAITTQLYGKFHSIYEVCLIRA